MPRRLNLEPSAEEVARDQTKRWARAVGAGMPVTEALATAYLCGLVQGTELMIRKGWLVIPEGE